MNDNSQERHSATYWRGVVIKLLEGLSMPVRQLCDIMTALMDDKIKIVDHDSGEENTKTTLVFGLAMLKLMQSTKDAVIENEEEWRAKIEAEKDPIKKKLIEEHFAEALDAHLSNREPVFDTLEDKARKALKRTLGVDMPADTIKELLKDAGLQ